MTLVSGWVGQSPGPDGNAAVTAPVPSAPAETHREQSVPAHRCIPSRQGRAPVPSVKMAPPPRRSEGAPLPRPLSPVGLCRHRPRAQGVVPPPVPDTCPRSLSRAWPSGHSSGPGCVRGVPAETHEQDPGCWRGHRHRQPHHSGWHRAWGPASLGCRPAWPVLSDTLSPVARGPPPGVLRARGPDRAGAEAPCRAVWGPDVLSSVFHRGWFVLGSFLKLPEPSAPATAPTPNPPGSLVNETGGAGGWEMNNNG